MSEPAALRTAAAALVAISAGCGAVGPDYEAPEPAVPAGFREAHAALTAAPADAGAWWRRLGDPVLDGLVARAARQSLDIREALARVQEARALRGVARAEHFPVLDSEVSYRRRRDSENTPLGPFAVEADRYFAGFEASWEIDLWGRIRRLVEAADADLAATVEAARAVAVAVAAETAASYVELRAMQERIAIARNNIALQEQTLALVRARFESGLVGERDVAQAASNLATTRSRVPALASAQRTAENRLTVLLGLPPGALAEELAAAKPVPVPPVEIAVGVPADLVRRRPDVRAAERELAAETARIGVAEGELYPRLTLLGSLGLESDHVSDLVDSGSKVFGIGPSIRWNVFDAGRLRGRVAAQDARADQAFVRWERAVLVALEETENAMTAFVLEQARRAQLDEAVTEARRAVEFAGTQYREGLTDFQNVLDSERELADLDDQLAQSRAAITANAVALYRALGGGWGGAAEPLP
jgi:NodT family efflux transporter outer membrane factor (OMF) lipoprotein